MGTAVSAADEITLEELESDPYPAYARLRRESPVAWVPAANVWFVTRFEDCAAVGRGDFGFVGATSHPTLQRVFGEPNVLTSGGPVHEDLRAGVDPRLKPRAVNEMIDDLVRPVARNYIRALHGSDHSELMADYFEPVSVEALRHVLGMEDLVDADTLRRWFTDLNLGASNFGLDPDIFAVSDRATAEIEDVVRPRLESLVKHPDDSMLSHMLWAGREGQEPRPVELIMPSLKVILLGGMQEPGHAAGSTLLGLYGEPEQFGRLRADPDSYIPLAVHEGLRWIAPIGAVERQASRAVEIHGQRIAEGAIVQVILASANRDEEHFEDPDRFLMDRSGGSHQAFGNGEHFCAGHFFARQLQNIMLEELLHALPGLEADPDVDPHVTGWVFRAPKTLPSRWTPQPVRESIEVGGPMAEPEAETDRFEVRVTSMRVEGDGILSLELSHPSGEELPRWRPGAHIDLWPEADRAGQYSLFGDPADRSRYRIAVLREETSRGVSTFVHDLLRPGMSVSIGGPRNHFELRPGNSYVFVAGGIGITPIISLARAARAGGADVEFHYCGRARSGMALRHEAEELGARFHISSEGGRTDLGEIVRSAATSRSILYACGPASMITTLEQLAADHSVDLVVEHFDGVQALREGDRPFTLELSRTGAKIEVPADRTALEELHAHGFPIRTSCGEGNCGSCETRVLAGDIDHRDVLLTKKQRAAGDRMMVCVSRAVGDSITLDI